MAIGALALSHIHTDIVVIIKDDLSNEKVASAVKTGGAGEISGVDWRG
jgi:hypothetical protein